MFLVFGLLIGVNYGASMPHLLKQQIHDRYACI
jgi:hypothetical protein